MKVILLQDVKNLGVKDNIVEVNDGYARNYLIPKGLVVQADADNINTIKTKKKALEKKKKKELEKAQKEAEALNGETIIIPAKAGENGKLFGSITVMDVADGIKKKTNIAVDKKKISVKEQIKSLSTYEVEIKLYKGVTAIMFVTVIDGLS